AALVFLWLAVKDPRIAVARLHPARRHRQVLGLLDATHPQRPVVREPEVQFHVAAGSNAEPPLCDHLVQTRIISPGPHRHGPSPTRVTGEAQISAPRS